MRRPGFKLHQSRRLSVSILVMHSGDVVSAIKSCSTTCTRAKNSGIGLFAQSFTVTRLIPSVRIKDSLRTRQLTIIERRISAKNIPSLQSEYVLFRQEVALRILVTIFNKFVTSMPKLSMYFI